MNYVGKITLLASVVVMAVLLSPSRLQVRAKNCSEPQIASQPLTGAIRWDAWRENNTNYGVSPSFYSDWAHRQPFYGWWNVNVPNHQAIIDQEINYAADNKLDYFAFVWYPSHAQYDHGDLMKPFQDYLASQYKSRIKFAFILQTFWVARGNPGDQNEMEARWRTETVPALVTLFNDAQYVKVAGNRPVVFWFGTAQLSSQPDGFGGAWQAEIQFLRDTVTTSGLGAPLFVDNNMDIGAAQMAGFHAVTSYGPSGAIPSGSCWTAQAAKDQSNWGPHSNLLTVLGLTPVHDPRPRNYGYYVQPPTYSEWRQHLQNAYTWVTNNPAKVTDPPLLLIYAWNELDEGGGGIVPTVQDGAKYLDAIKSVASAPPEPASTIVEVYNGDNCAFLFQGNWVDWTPAAGNYDGDDQISLNNGNEVTLTVAGSTRFTLHAIKGPNRGSFEIYIDGASQGIINQNDPNWLPVTVLFQSAVLPSGSHTLRFVNRSSHPSATQASFDKITVQRTLSNTRH